MTDSPGDVLNLIRDNEVQIIDLRFADLPGLMQHFSVPAHELTEEGFEEGFGFDGSSIRGFQEIQESDMLLVPDPETAYLDPFTRHTTLNLHCFVKDPVTGEMYSRDPRHVARKAELYLQQTGIAVIVRALQELERDFRVMQPGVGVRQVPQVAVGVTLELDQVPPIEPRHGGGRAFRPTHLAERHCRLALSAEGERAHLPLRGIAKPARAHAAVCQAGDCRAIVTFELERAFVRADRLLVAPGEDVFVSERDEAVRVQRIGQLSALALDDGLAGTSRRTKVERVRIPRVGSIGVELDRPEAFGFSGRPVPVAQQVDPAEHDVRRRSAGSVACQQRVAPRIVEHEQVTAGKQRTMGDVARALHDQ